MAMKRMMEGQRAAVRPAETASARRAALSGGASLLPGSGGMVDLFANSLDELAPYEKAQPGWAMRFEIPDPLPPEENGAWSVGDLIVEVTYTSGGFARTVEFEAFPWASFHIAADTVAARLRWSDDVIGAAQVPPVQLIWTCVRGFCPVHASRSYLLTGARQTPGQPVVHSGPVPPWAKNWALYSGSNPPVDGLIAIADGTKTLSFQPQTDSLRTVHAYSSDEVLAAVGGVTRLPPGARVWRWEWDYDGAAAPDMRLAFGLGSEDAT